MFASFMQCKERGFAWHACGCCALSESRLTHRRSRLPAVTPGTDVGLWSLLFRNIGKDLSKISMPVSMNEPLNSLQVSATCFCLPTQSLICQRCVVC